MLTFRIRDIGRLMQVSIEWNGQHLTEMQMPHDAWTTLLGLLKPSQSLKLIEEPPNEEPPVAAPPGFTGRLVPRH